MRLVASEQLQKEIDEELKLVNNLDHIDYTVSELIELNSKEFLDSIDKEDNDDENKDNK